MASESTWCWTTWLMFESMFDEISRRIRWLAHNTAPNDLTERIIQVDGNVYVVLSGDLIWVEVVVSPDEATIVHIEEIETGRSLGAAKSRRRFALDSLRARMVLDDLADV